MRKIKNLKEYSVSDSLFPRFRSLAAAASRQIKVGIPKKKFYSFACPVAI